MEPHMSYQRIGISPLSGTFGAELSGVDLSKPLDDETFAEIRRAWLDYKVIFFRDQHLTPEQHRDFGGRFGDFQKPGFVPVLKDYPEIRRQEVKLGGVSQDIWWHTDDAFLDIPSKGSVLYALKVPDAGGDTVWANMAAAYDALSDQMQNFLGGLTAIHDVSFRNALSAIDKWGPEHYKNVRASVPPVEHPVIRTHPETGRKSIFVTEQLTSHMKGMTAKESEALLKFLFSHTQQEEFLCRFKWRDHSVAFWDNRCTQHRGIFDFSADAYRLMHRVAIADSARPV
jgi:taurine dioxygenase